MPSAFVAKGGERLNHTGLNEPYENTNHRKENIVLEPTRTLDPGETVNLQDSINANYSFYK